MNDTAKKLREAAAYVKDCGIASVFAIAQVRVGESLPYRGRRQVEQKGR